MATPNTIPRLMLRYLGTKHAESAPKETRLVERFLTCSDSWPAQIEPCQLQIGKYRNELPHPSFLIEWCYKYPTSSSTCCRIYRLVCISAEYANHTHCRSLEYDSDKLWPKSGARPFLIPRNVGIWSNQRWKLAHYGLDTLNERPA